MRPLSPGRALLDRHAELLRRAQMSLLEAAARKNVTSSSLDMSPFFTWSILETRISQMMLDNTKRGVYSMYHVDGIILDEASSNPSTPGLGLTGLLNPANHKIGTMSTETGVRVVRPWMCDEARRVRAAENRLLQIKYRAGSVLDSSRGEGWVPEPPTDKRKGAIAKMNVDRRCSRGASLKSTFANPIIPLPPSVDSSGVPSKLDIGKPHAQTPLRSYGGSRRRGGAAQAAHELLPAMGETCVALCHFCLGCVSASPSSLHSH